MTPTEMENLREGDVVCRKRDTETYTVMANYGRWCVPVVSTFHVSHMDEWVNKRGHFKDIKQFKLGDVVSHLLSPRTYYSVVLVTDTYAIIARAVEINGSNCHRWDRTLRVEHFLPEAEQANKSR